MHIKTLTDEYFKKLIKSIRLEFGNLKHLEAVKIIQRYDYYKTDNDKNRIQRRILSLLGIKQ